MSPFPISRDPPEGGTVTTRLTLRPSTTEFPISRDPPEGGTIQGYVGDPTGDLGGGFQFLGIPPKGELLI